MGFNSGFKGLNANTDSEPWHPDPHYKMVYYRITVTTAETSQYFEH